MWINIDEAIKIYARFWTARHGAAGVKALRHKAGELRNRGDLTGSDVWNEVADEVQKEQERATH